MKELKWKIIENPIDELIKINVDGINKIIAENKRYKKAFIIVKDKLPKIKNRFPQTYDLLNSITDEALKGEQDE